MKKIQLPKLSNQQIVMWWAILGFTGIVVALLAILAMAGIFDSLAAALSLAPVSVGGKLLCFMAGVALGLWGMWGIYKHTPHHPPPAAYG